MGKSPTKKAVEVEPDEPKKVWNSLEIARLAVGVSTPLAIFALGMVFTLSNQKEAMDRDDRLIVQANDRQDRATRDARILADRATRAAREQEAINRQEARRDAAQAAASANQREIDLRQQANAFELAQTRTANQRDDSLRRLAEDDRRQNRIFEIRLRGWEAASEDLAIAIHRLNSLRDDADRRQLGIIEAFDPAKISEARTLVVRGVSRIRRYESFYSLGFLSHVNGLENSALALLGELDACTRVRCDYGSINGFMRVHTKCFNSLIVLARAEIGGVAALTPLGDPDDQVRCI